MARAPLEQVRNKEIRMSDELNLYPPWRQAVENFRAAGFTYGDFVSLVWLYENLGIQMPRDGTPHAEAKRLELRFLGQFSTFRRQILEEMQMDLEAGAKGEDGRGYLVISPQDQTRLAMQDGRRDITRSLRRMHRRVANVNTSNLTADQRRENADAMARIASLAAIARRRIRNNLGHSEGQGESHEQE